MGLQRENGKWRRIQKRGSGIRASGFRDPDTPPRRRHATWTRRRKSTTPVLTSDQSVDADVGSDGTLGTGSDLQRLRQMTDAGHRFRPAKAMSPGSPAKRQPSRDVGDQSEDLRLGRRHDGRRGTRQLRRLESSARDTVVTPGLTCHLAI